MDTDPIKEMLKAIRDAVCGVKAKLVNATLPLTPETAEYVAQKISDAATKGERLLNTETSVLFTPAVTWVFWEPVQLAANPTLPWLADQSCDEAQAALDAYCANDPLPPGEADAEQAARSLWRASMLYPYLMHAAGVSPMSNGTRIPN